MHRIPDCRMTRSSSLGLSAFQHHPAGRLANSEPQETAYESHTLTDERKGKGDLRERKKLPRDVAMSPFVFEIGDWVTNPRPLVTSGPALDDPSPNPATKEIYRRNAHETCSDECRRLRHHSHS